MNNNLVMDAISYLDAELLAVHLEKKAELRARAKAKKKMILQWGAIAACIALILCMVPIVNMIFNGSHGDAPVSVEYNDINEAHNQLGFDTLYAKLDYDVATTRKIMVSYKDDGAGNAVISEPTQLLIRQIYKNNNEAVNVNFYILFDKADVNDSYIGGYEEQGLSEEINGVKVHYSNIFDGSNHAQAKFIYKGNLYVIDAISSGEIDLDYFLEKLLK